MNRRSSIEQSVSEGQGQWLSSTIVPSFLFVTRLLIVSPSLYLFTQQKRWSVSISLNIINHQVAISTGAAIPSRVIDDLQTCSGFFFDWPSQLLEQDVRLGSAKNYICLEIISWNLHKKCLEEEVFPNGLKLSKLYCK